MHISFEEDVATDNLVEAFRPVFALLSQLGITRLSCLHLDGFAWKDGQRVNVETNNGKSVFVNVAPLDLGEAGVVEWSAEFQGAGAGSGTDWLNSLNTNS